MNPITQFRELGIPVGSYVAAIRHLNDRQDLIKCEYERLIHDLTGVQRNYVDHREARYSFLYLVQETIRKSDTTNMFNMVEMLDIAEACANKLFTEQAYHWAVSEEEIQTDSFGRPKRKKGAKQIEALRIYNENIDEGKDIIIKLFMSELDMSKSGATTYYYNTKKKVEL